MFASRIDDQLPLPAFAEKAIVAAVTSDNRRLVGGEYTPGRRNLPLSIGHVMLTH
jgi:hypothetical protein